jgi:hypothetical protein
MGKTARDPTATPIRGAKTPSCDPLNFDGFVRHSALWAHRTGSYYKFWLSGNRVVADWYLDFTMEPFTQNPADRMRHETLRSPTPSTPMAS